jgi:hypothetical protein
MVVITKRRSRRRIVSIIRVIMIETDGDDE